MTEADADLLENNGFSDQSKLRDRIKSADKNDFDSTQVKGDGRQELQDGENTTDKSNITEGGRRFASGFRS